MRKIRTPIFLLLIVWSMMAACNAEKAPEITVSAASNLIPAFTEIGQQFTTETGIQVTYNFASSGNLAQQISQGAPVDLFVSANEAYVTQLIEADIIEPTSFDVYALGRLVVWSNDPTLVPQQLTDLTAPRFERIAIANPEHAPYGIVAKHVLQQNNLWTTLQSKTIMGNDVRQTLTYAQTNQVSAALVPLSLVINLPAGDYYLIPATMHPPIKQALGIIKTSPHQPQVAQFVTYILSEKGQTILNKYGYEGNQAKEGE